MAEPKYNQDELVPPSFLNEQFLLDILKAAEDDPNLHLIDFDVKPGSKAGDHYGSVMFKITVSYGTTCGKVVPERRFLLKTMPELDGQKKQFLSQIPLFAMEIKIYTEVLPEMEKILGQFGESGFWPKVVYSSAEEESLLFDDLTQGNFQMVYDLLNVNDIQLVTDRIAKYHALSMCLVERGLFDPTQLAQIYKSKAIKEMMVSTKQFIKPLAQAIQTWPDFESLGEKIEANIENIFDNYFKCFDDDANGNSGYRVLVHGDFHIRNMMFRKDDQGALIDCVFLDFQAPNFQSPAFDVYSLLNCVGSREARAHRWDVVKMYYKVFADSLRMYGFKGKVPSLNDLQVELLRKSNYDAYQALCMVSIAQIDLSQIELSELFNESGENPLIGALNILFKEPGFIADMKVLVKSLDDRGVFD